MNNFHSFLFSAEVLVVVRGRQTSVHYGPQQFLEKQWNQTDAAIRPSNADQHLVFLRYTDV